MQSFYDEQDTLKRFRGSLDEENYPNVPSASQRSIQTLRYKLWNLVEYRNRSMSTRVGYRLVYLFLVSVFTFNKYITRYLFTSIKNTSFSQYHVKKCRMYVNLEYLKA
jgi:hypothetical protein